MAKRMYLVQLTRKKVLVEAASQEAAIRAATASMVKSVTLPTALETARIIAANEAEVISDTVKPAAAPQEEEPREPGEGVGRLGLSGDDGDDSGGQQSEAGC